MKISYSFKYNVVSDFLDKRYNESLSEKKKLLERQALKFYKSVIPKEFIQVADNHSELFLFSNHMHIDGEYYLRDRIDFGDNILMPIPQNFSFSYTKSRCGAKLEKLNNEYHDLKDEIKETHNKMMCSINNIWSETSLKRVWPEAIDEINENIISSLNEEEEDIPSIMENFKHLK